MIVVDSFCTFVADGRAEAEMFGAETRDVGVADRRVVFGPTGRGLFCVACISSFRRFSPLSTITFSFLFLLFRLVFPATSDSANSSARRITVPSGVVKRILIPPPIAFSPVSSTFSEPTTCADGRHSIWQPVGRNMLNPFNRTGRS